MEKLRGKIVKRRFKDETIGDYKIGEEVEVELRYKVYKKEVLPNGETDVIIDFMDGDDIELIDKVIRDRRADDDS